MRWILAALLSTIIANAPVLAQGAAVAVVPGENAEDKIAAAREFISILIPNAYSTTQDGEPITENTILNPENPAQLFTQAYPKSLEQRNRRNSILEKFLLREFSAQELKEISAFTRSGLFEKMTATISKVLEKSIEECNKNPNYSIEVRETQDMEKKELVDKFMNDKSTQATNLLLMACITLAKEDALINEWSTEDLRTYYDFMTSNSGKKLFEFRGRMTGTKSTGRWP
jgi:hypothetical protein